MSALCLSSPTRAMRWLSGGGPPLCCRGLIPGALGTQVRSGQTRLPAVLVQPAEPWAAHTTSASPPAPSPSGARVLFTVAPKPQLPRAWQPAGGPAPTPLREAAPPGSPWRQRPPRGLSRWPLGVTEGVSRVFRSQASPSLLWASVSPSRNRAVRLAAEVGRPHPGSSDRSFEVPRAQVWLGQLRSQCPPHGQGNCGKRGERGLGPERPLRRHSLPDVPQPRADAGARLRAAGEPRAAAPAQGQEVN